jgi:RuvB-like protein 2
MVEIPLGRKETTDITPVTVDRRASAHSHIRGLGLDESLHPRQRSEGLIGQQNARRALGIVMKLIQRGKIAGRGLLLAGQPGTGKTALAHALSQSLGVNTPFTTITGSEVFSLEMNKTEALTQALRRSIGVKIHEVSEVCEGEIVSIEIHAPSAEKAVRTGTMTLKTTDMESIFDLGPRLIDQITRLQLQEGDIISIDIATGNVSKIGRSFSHAGDFDASGPQLKYVHTPDGELKTRRETVHTLTLHEIDVVNSRNQGFLALFSGDTGEIKQEIRDHVNQQVAQWQEERKAELIAGVLFIDEVHMLDIECFSFLNRAMETEHSPIIIMASNRGHARIRGTNSIGPHGIPPDLIQRLTIIPTEAYKENDLKAILEMRCAEEDVTVSEEALEYLTRIAMERSLRYSMQLITISYLVAHRRDKDDEVQKRDVSKALRLFLDTKRSEEALKRSEQQSVYIETDFMERNVEIQEEEDEGEK